jgi:hypothetical protein
MWSNVAILTNVVLQLLSKTGSLLEYKQIEKNPPSLRLNLNSGKVKVLLE